MIKVRCLFYEIKASPPNALLSGASPVRSSIPPSPSRIDIHEANCAHYNPNEIDKRTGLAFSVA